MLHHLLKIEISADLNLFVFGTPCKKKQLVFHFFRYFELPKTDSKSVIPNQQVFQKKGPQSQLTECSSKGKSNQLNHGNLF